MRVVFRAICAAAAGLVAVANCQLLLGAEAGTLGKLSYGVEWRLIRAGTAVIEMDGSEARLKLDSAGLVSALYKVEDTYTGRYAEGLCEISSVLEGKEGKRHRRTEINIDRNRNRASYVERDLLKDSVTRSSQIDVPHCVHDVLGSIFALRELALSPGQSVQLPITDGRRAAQVKVEAQEREDVTTLAGTFHTVRYEANLMNGVVYPRSGRVFIWLTDDPRKLPVQFRLRLSFPIGTVTLQLEKEFSP